LIVKGVWITTTPLIYIMNNDETKTVNDFDSLVEEVWKRAALNFVINKEFSPPYNPRFNEYIDNLTKKVEDESQINLQPWISIIDIAILWLSSVHLLIEEARLKDDNSELLTPYALTGAACSQAVAIRKLCLCGLDNSAKIILRTLIDTLNICTITLYDPTLRKQYQEAQEFEKANKFWRNHLRDQDINPLLKIIMGKMNLNDEDQDVLIDYQKEEKKLLHQTVHSSYIAAALASTVQSSDQSTYPSAIFGASTIFSVRTLTFACKSIWLFSLIGFKLLFKPLDKSNPLLESDPNNNSTKIIACSYFVLNEIILKYWDKEIIEVN
jgi:hypothetical protein